MEEINEIECTKLSHSKKYRQTILAWQQRHKEHYNKYQNDYRKRKYAEGYKEVVKARRESKQLYEKEAKLQRLILIDSQ